MIKLKSILFSLAIGAGILKASEKASLPFTIQFTEKGTGWPVPLVEIRTTHQVRFFSDNAGIIAFDLLELMGKDTWIDVVGNGYDVPKDGFGYRGVRIKPIPGGKIRIELQRNINAKRIGRLTGAGIFAESQKLGLEKEWIEQDVLGCDSVQNAVHGGRMFWLWGDTTLAHYPLGIFDCSSATTAIKPLNALTPPLRLKFDYFADAGGKPRGVAKMPGTGPTWVSGYTSLRDKSGVAYLVGSYVKIKPPMDAYESGLCVWNDSKKQFEQHRVIWTKSDSNPKPPPIPEGHPVFWRDEKNREWVLFGNPLPTLRCPANFEGWQDPVQWEILKPQTTLASVSDGKAVKPHSGSIAWNAYRKKFVTVFMESFGNPSSFGELWYAEAENPLGPWGQTIKILSHENYTFYNPRIHPEFTEPDSPVLLFEGTYTMQFANKPAITPRYDYNQILYRLDLDDPALIKAQASQHQSHVEPLESIIVSADKRGFAFKKSAITFRPWGVNYGNHGRLMEDFWESEWETISDDFREIKELGANVVRLHLQYGKFMEAPDKPNVRAFQQLSRLLHLAETNGLYLDITGLACYRPSDVPPWYDRLSEKARWESQACFWRAVAEQCASSPAVFLLQLDE